MQSRPRQYNRVEALSAISSSLYRVNEPSWITRSYICPINQFVLRGLKNLGQNEWGWTGLILGWPFSGRFGAAWRFYPPWVWKPHSSLSSSYGYLVRHLKRREQCQLEPGWRSLNPALLQNSSYQHSSGVRQTSANLRQFRTSWSGVCQAPWKLADQIGHRNHTGHRHWNCGYS